MTAKPMVFVVDDEERVRRALRRLIQSVGLEVETYASAEEFLTHYEHRQPGCLVLDIRMPGLNGLELQTSLLANNVHLPIVFITGHGDIPMSVRAMKAGAVDFIEKPFNDQVLLDAIHAAIRRDAQLRRRAAERQEILQRFALLTGREREVMTLVVAGKANKQIAAMLGTSEQTIKVHRGRVMGKMGVDSVAQLVHLAERAGLCQTGS